MKIGIIGTGNMGRSLGIVWAEQGHEVFFGSRDEQKGKAIAESAGHSIQGGTNDQAAAFGDVILYTVRGILPSAVLASTQVLAGKILIDCNNWDIPEGYAYEPIVESLAEKVAADVPNVHVIKAFNTQAQELYELSPTPLKDHQVSCFICGDDEQARQTVMALAEDIGLTPVDCGPLQTARLIEGLADFIRFMMGGMKLGPYATISVNQLPAAQGQRLGGRQPSSLK
ncbi:NADPH-dependent F420 reductase [Leptolyngbya sp. FACHB-261]|uniref:NADPH-dependent F420 reductase n=1 Tax=Leptolyngbya sp. FACHB-261 TaxID=2692806 RepID=UPI001684EEFD|nr:NADPH-dependent F420 reductase [Leptolyngbya sp. FACHB-261]MBD2102261.1 NADPH-dependent F420 reductase [Leptolyngbya sp. FACHB-261]